MTAERQQRHLAAASHGRALSPRHPGQAQSPDPSWNPLDFGIGFLGVGAAMITVLLGASSIT
jgi:hypothetical protein